MKINEIISCGASVTVAVTPTDLKEFALYLIDEAKKMAKADDRQETYLTAKEAAERLNVSANTLWRWRKENYLVPSKVGNKSYYKLSDIERLKGGLK